VAGEDDRARALGKPVVTARAIEGSLREFVLPQNTTE
jgi:hypothetical protein